MLAISSAISRKRLVVSKSKHTVEPIPGKSTQSTHFAKDVGRACGRALLELCGLPGGAEDGRSFGRGVDGDGQVVSPKRANSRRYAISFVLFPGKGFRGSRKVSSQGG
mgnify:CR=1 FL=1